MKREINLLFLLLILLTGKGAIGQNNFFQIGDESPYIEDFEGETTSLEFFQSNNDANLWYVGTAASHGGQKGLYISNDGGNTIGYTYSSNSMAFAYVPIGVSAGNYQISYDWHHQGGDADAFLRVALAPCTPNPFWGYPGPNNFEYSRLPEYWIALDGGSGLGHSPDWTSEMARLSFQQISQYYLVFAWRNTSSSSGLDAAAIDNIRIEKVSVFVPEQPVASNISGHSATITWADPHATAWNIRYKKTNPIENEWTTINSVTQNSHTLTNLDDGTQYEVQVQAINNNQNSAWTTSALFNTDVIVSQENPYQEDFEGATLFHLVNDLRVPNRWCIGTAAHHGSGTKGLYISKDGGNTNSYSNNWTIEFAYVQLGLEGGQYEIAYDWKCIGKDQYDYMRVALVPATTNLTGGSTPSDFSYNTLPTGWIAADDGSQLCLSQEWSSKDVIVSVNENGSYYLVFAWCNKGVYPIDPPAAIDNISVSRLAVAPPTQLAVSDITFNSATITWHAPYASAWNVRYKATNQGENEWNIINSVTQNTYTLTGLDAHTQYEVQVQTTSLSGQSEWTASVIFATKNDIDYDRPYFENFEAATTFLFSESYDGNQWYIGTAACNGTGSKGLYVTKDQGASNSYWTHPSFACNVYAYVPVSLTAGLYEISYDWRNIGKLDQDYMRVALVPSTASLSSSNYVSDLSHNTLPAGWIAADGGSQLNQSQEWSSKTSGLTITNETAGDYYLVFVWHNDAANYAANPPAAVDNLSVEKVYAFTPELLTASNITANSATISWANATVTSWNLRYREAGNGSWSETIPVAQNQYTLTGLQRSINYEVQVQAVVQSGPSHWASLTFMTKNAVDFGQAYEEDFENETTLFQFANETANSKWYIGAAAHNGEGSSRGLYISNDSGNSNAYTYNTPSMVYAYVPITISSGKHEISYDWRCNGELDCDYMRVALVPATANLVGGTNAPSGFSHNSLPEGWIAADGGNQLCQSSEWSTKTERLTLTEGDYFLVFAWRNNNSIAYNPPAAVDNVHVEIVHAYTPLQLAVTDITSNSAKATWSDTYGTAWNIRYKKTSESEWTTTQEPVTGREYTLTALDSDTEYEVQVQATSTEGQSAWTASAIFSTVPTYTLTYDANGATSGNVPVDPNSPYIADATVTVLGNTGGLIKTNHNFNGWNTKADGTGTAYAAGETFQISAHTVLYAQWLYDMTIIDPDNLHASLITGKSATLNWSAGSNSNPTGWNLDYKLHDAQAWTNLATNLAAATTNYLLENLVVDTEYDFRVQAIFGNNTSSWVEASFSTASTIVIGEATSSTHILPTFSTSRYSLTQQIYTADEINRTGFITSIAFNCTSGSGNWRNLDIYLVQTDKSTFDDETDWIHVTEDDLHFGYRMVGFKEGWSTIELLPPFEYDGLSNLCLVVYDHTQYACPDNDRIECMTIGTGVPSGLACINSNEINPNYPPTNSSATQYHKNQLRLTFEDTPAPIYFEFSDLTATDATVTWTPCGQETSWELQYIEDEDDNWDQAQTVTVTDNSHTYILSGLTPRTWYKSRIRAVVENDYSKWSETLYFVTPCLEEDKIPISFILRNCQGTGWNGAELYIYDSDQDYEFEPITLGNELSEQTFTINACAGDEILLYWDCGENPVPYSFDVVIEGADVLHMEEYLEHYDDYIEDFFLVEAPACSAPIDLTAEVTPEQTVLTWDGNGATEWMLAYKQIGEESWYFVDETLTDPTYTLEDLETNRYYKYQVASICQEDVILSVPYYFFVPMCPVEEQCLYTFNLYQQYNDWWYGACLVVRDADSYEEIASITIDEGDDIPKTVDLPLCQGTNIELVWYGGYYESRCGFEVFDGNGDLVASKQFDEELGYEYVFELGEVTCGSCKVPKHLQVIVNGEVEATLNATVGEPIDLTPYIPAEAPTDGFEFYGWYRNDECPDCFNYNYEWAPVTYGNTHTASIDDYPITTIKAIFCQPVGKTYMEFNSIPQNDTLLILGNGASQYGLNGSATPIMLAFDDDGNFLEEWVDDNQQPQSLESLLWIVESVDDGFHLRNKANNTYLAINDGQICSTGQNGAYLFHHEIHGSEFGDLLYIKVGENTHLEFDTDHFIVANDADYYYTNYGYYYSNVIFNSKQKIGKHYTTRFLIYGDDDTFEATPAVHIINGEVTNDEYIVNGSDGYYTSGLIIIKDGGVFNDRGELYNYDEDVLIIEDGGQLIHRGDVVATVEKNIAGYGAGNANTRNGWNFIATPIGDGTEVSTLQTESAYDLYRYDEPSRFWLDTDENRISTLDNSTGYLYANEEDVTLQFKGLLYTNSNVGKTLSCQAEGDLAGFNLIGNPYAYNLGLNDIYFDSDGEHQSIESIYVIDGTRIVVAQNDAAIVKPCEGFFVKALEDDAYFVFAPNRLGGLAYSSMPTPDLKIEVAKAERGAELLDRAYLNFNAARNVEKLVLDKNATRLSLVSEGKHYAALSASNEGTMPLNFTAVNEGTYTLTVSAERTEATYLHLLDKLTGADIDLLESGSYTFKASIGDDAMRFEIVFKTK